MTDDYKIELRKAKPFAGYTQVELASTAEQILAKLPKSVEEAQFDSLMEPLSFLWNILSKPQRTKLNKAMNAHAAGLQAIRWLPKVKAIIERQSHRETPRGHGHVYFVLIDATKYISEEKTYGIYVGQSKYTPERRLKNHQSGRHASPIVRDHGQFILESLSYRFAPISKKEALRLEAECLRALKSAKLSNLPEKIIRGS
jgi:predicted GIY-YIG superfamily endonuclease